MGKARLSEEGISFSKTGDGFEYRIDQSKGYSVDNRTPFEMKDGVVLSRTPLKFKILQVAQDSMERSEGYRSVLVISDAPNVSEPSSESVKTQESIYVAQSNDALRNEVTLAMRGITSRHIRQRVT